MIYEVTFWQLIVFGLLGIALGFWLGWMFNKEYNFIEGIRKDKEAKE